MLGLSRRPRALLPVLLLAVALAGCDSGGGGEVEASTDTILFGVNFTRLFAPATAAEVAAVEAEWDARTPAATGAEVLASTTIDGATVAVVRHGVEGSGSAAVTHYGVVRIPAGLSDAPVLVVHHGGDDGIAIDALTSNTGVRAFASVFAALADETVQVFPVYRSETLTTTGYAALGGPYTATGDPSPWDYDVDDSMALLDAALALFDAQTDADRVAAIGFSRGGDTAALHAIRDGRVDALVDYYGPTDFFSGGAQGLATLLLGSGDRSAPAFSLPGADYLFDNVLTPLQGAGGTYDSDADYATARLDVVRRSAAVFADRLPPTQVHHHYRDGVVPFTFSEAFAADAEPVAAFELFAYGAPATRDADLSPVYHAPELSPEMQPSVPRVEAFLQAALGLGAATRAPAALAL